MICCLPAKRSKKKHCRTKHQLNNRLPDDDLDTVVASGPLDLDVVALGDDLATVDLAGDGRAREHTISGGTGAGAGLPGGTAVGNNVDGTEVLVSQVARWPACGVGGRGGQ